LIDIRKKGGEFGISEMLVDIEIIPIQRTFQRCAEGIHHLPVSFPRSSEYEVRGNENSREFLRHSRESVESVYGDRFMHSLENLPIA
jgi:hypothetical protein